MKNKLNIKIIIIVLAVVVVAVGAFLFLKSKGKEKEEKSKSSPAAEENYSVSLEEMYSNIKNSKKILKVKITVQTSVEANKEIIEAKQFVIRDEANKIIRNTTEDDLSGEGYENVRRAIQKTVQKYFSDETIVVYFDDFVFQ